ncbi:MAG: hypothetical protein WA125_05300 [Desulfosporosinus sp.]
MNCTFTKAFKEDFFGVGLNGSLCNFISFVARIRRSLATTAGYDEPGIQVPMLDHGILDRSNPRRPKPEEVS